MDSRLISVDRWAQGSQVYFLTHLHADHTKGLSSTWARGPLFCSRLTAKLFPFKFPDLDLSLLRILDIGRWHSLSLVSHSGSETTFQVMAIDADHCPGSVMLLFRGEFGCMLYTGDFRWEATSERAKKGRDMLLSALKDDVVDTLYLDNTYCNPSYDFPSRQLAAQQVIDIIVSNPEHDIIIGIDTLGKEDLLLQISSVLKIKIWVWPERLQTMHLLGFRDNFTTNSTLTRVRAVPRYSFSIDTLEGLNTSHPTIGIMPSGLPWVRRPVEQNGDIFGSFLRNRYKRGKCSAQGEIQTLERIHQYMYSVPYSDHSNFAEIEDFVKLVQPTNLKGIVSSSSCYVEPIYYFGRLCGANQSTSQLRNRHKRKGSDEMVGTVCPDASYGDNNFVGSERKRGKTLKVKFSGVRLSRLSILRRKNHRGAKIVENNSDDQNS
ncbi:hypothetical protein L6164_022276 [Bauhinia variegata]|uniref:Uncharacterized protein n=1 Tax=Bauhinia variegata TaxID=167791 RepID=A0ACB9MGK1_BAUVA|nr:hypothetical protein L6164_022276 [Bauhinia variegata]